MPKTVLSLFALTVFAVNTVFAADTAMQFDSQRLQSTLAAQSGETKARYSYRRPLQTLKFFGIAPGMTLVEAGPGAGWYSKILVDYLGSEGQLIGAGYSMNMVKKMDGITEEAINRRAEWVSNWPKEASGWASGDSAGVSAFEWGSMPARLEGKADAVLFVRAMHGLARFEDNGGHLTEALADAWRALKPGGIVGIVQHHARDNMSDDWASGRNGYLKKGYIIEKMTQAGFELVAESDMNANRKDQPTESDMVWRLPPSLATSKDDPEAQARFRAIGESNRITLKFRKPE